MGSKARDEAARRAVKAKVDTMRRHAFVCVEDDCGNGTKRAKEMRKVVAAAGARSTASVTDASCLGICERGPICVVYPEGTWYHSVTSKRAEQIAAEHLVDGTPVTKGAFLTNDLS